MQIRPCVLMVGWLTVAACSLYTDQPGAGDGAKRETTIVPVGPLNRDLDVLFVIDDSGSMGEEQDALATNFPRFIDVLATIAGGVPNLHLGVVSTNVGSGGVNLGGCSSATAPAGDDGDLLTNDCAGLTDAFVADLAAPDGTRQRNYTGDLATVFSCMARLGTGGCGFEQPLESMFRALQPGKNPGFLRAAARLAVIIISDEDDCSAQPGATLFGDPNATITSPLGPRTSFRCHEFGVACDDDPDPRAPGTRTGCVPREDSALIQPIARYVDFLRALKPRATDVVVAGIIGRVDDARTAVVTTDAGDPASPRPALEPSCASAVGVAFPGFRLRSFLDGFPARNQASSICTGDLSETLVGIADALKVTLGVPCVGLDLADQDPAAPGVQPACVVTEFQDRDGTRTDEVTVPACDASAGPCWRLIARPDVCATTPGNWTLAIEGRTTPPSADTFVAATCVVN